ncbi:MAG: hypothetical protein COU07_02545 [Candidatus Harrisonbacteria bacterium CG10_big_fil_rev_8_21_14_0_10_40_38]|uniref:Glutamate/phenylalanine/leucine/valine/L-tryptophan dehydrogenase C-terminal domain-containing protein n=1 Tax=Candidatus Harrisonbacteria bacterium CG10_big_fil_rev_8_21_14_0_10_40_38 TaxID=1974583 RepID=A0A2H0URP9_9BACT|nr:MAG: hypothetical protein COU07_02545 [Candidatus Harrisonbacteria bacterium CG10_big_fil_rev_8_21_14_0_10_40_38]
MALKTINRTDDIKSNSAFKDHELIVEFSDDETSLHGFIAVHNSNLGPATGGTRMFPYTNENNALEDVLRLSRAMTYKCAIAGVSHGGGKAVIIGDSQKIKTKELIISYANAVNSLNGKFTTGEDVGISEDDVQLMFKHSSFFIGKKGVAGDPSPYAALSTFYCIQTALSERFGSDSLKDKTVSVKGVGKVGAELVRLLIESGANIIVADINNQTIDELKQKFPQIKVADANTIHKEKADVFAPCAMGKELTKTTIEEIIAPIICGSANNQLESDEIGDALYAKKIMYIPDYVANAGGLIDVIDEREEGGYSKERVLSRIANLKNTLSEIFQRARKENIPFHRVANKLAEERFMNARK